MTNRFVVRSSAPARRTLKRRFHPLFDTVESRLLLSTFTVTNTSDFDDGSLRQAIIDSNATPGANTINFNIPGAGVQVIQPFSALPAITNPVVIDGSTQPGSVLNTAAQSDNAKPMIELDGEFISSPTQSVGLQIKADNSTVRGLAIDNFGALGLLLAGANEHLEGSFVGIDPTGKVAQPNGLGVAVLGSAVVGGPTAATRNVISGNTAGLAVASLALSGTSTLLMSTPGSVVENNLIGTDATGVGDLGNTFVGVAVAGSGNVIGAGAGGQANTIAFNGKAGAAVNLGAGIVVAGLHADAGSPVSLASTGNLISANAIYGNHGLGIGLLDAPTSTLLPLVSGARVNIPSVLSNLLSNINLGVSPNVHLRPATGPNNLQNFPVLSSALAVNGVTTVRGSLDATPNTTYRIQFFSNPSADPSGYGQGRVFLGQATVATDANGLAPIAFVVPTGVPAGQVIAATAIDPGNDTSEFSKAVTADVVPIVSVGADATVQLGTALAQFGSVADPTALPLTATVDYGDGSGPSALALNADKTFALIHLYTSPGTYRPTVTVSDSLGVSSTASFQVTVVSQPTQVSSIDFNVSKQVVTSVVVHFGTAVNGAGNAANYHLAFVTSKHVKGKLVTVTKTVPIKSVTYDANAHTATILPFGRLAPGKVNQLTITASGISNAYGQALDGNRDGVPGGNVVAGFDLKKNKSI